MLRTSFLRAACASVAALMIPNAIAAPTLELRAGQTTVELSTEFLGAVTSLGVAVTPVSGGAIRSRNGKTTAVFPVTNGSVDTGLLRLEVIHSGGLSLRAGDTIVTLSQFNIENVTGGALRLKGIVTANDVIVGEVPLFDLTLTESPSARPSNLLRSDINLGGSLRLAGVRVALSGEAAAALNSVFKVTAFSRGLNIGTASVDAFFDERLNLL
jgi:hypothetical protein